MCDHQDIELVGDGKATRSAVWNGEATEAWAASSGELELEIGEGDPGVCSRCGRRVEREHEWLRRAVRDLPILGAETTLLMDRRRFDRDRCGPKLERLSWLEPWARVTNRVADAVPRLCARSSGEPTWVGKEEP